jgi:hypothetical protein
MDNDQTDGSSPADDMATLFRQHWMVIEGGRPVKALRDNLEWSVRVDRRRRARLKLL